MLKFRVGTTHFQSGKACRVLLGGGGKKVSKLRPCPGTLAGYPWAQEPPAYIGVELPGDFEARHNSPSHLQARYSLRSFFSQRLAPTFVLRPRCHRGIIGGTDLKRQGQ